MTITSRKRQDLRNFKRRDIKIFVEYKFRKRIYEISGEVAVF